MRHGRATFRRNRERGVTAKSGPKIGSARGGGGGFKGGGGKTHRRRLEGGERREATDRRAVDSLRALRKAASVRGSGQLRKKARTPGSTPWLDQIGGRGPLWYTAF